MTAPLLVTRESLLTVDQVRAYLRCSRETARAVVSGLDPVSVGIPVYLAGEVLERARAMSGRSTSQPRRPASRALGRTEDDVV